MEPSQRYDLVLSKLGDSNSESIYVYQIVDLQIIGL